MHLFPFQKEGVQFLQSRRRAVLTDEMGLGKTIQALCALPPDAATLIVCPASLKCNWENEVKKWTELEPEILSGRGSFRWPVAGEVLITNYEILPDGHDLPAVWHPVHAIVDEAHALKNFKAQRTRHWRGMLAELIEADGSAWLLTGTPIITSPIDLWGLLESADLAADAYGSFEIFKEIWGARLGSFDQLVWHPHAIKKDLAREGLDRVTFGRSRADVLPELPAKRWTQIDVPIPRGVGKVDLDDLAMLRSWADGNKPLKALGQIARARKELAIAKVAGAIKLIDTILDGGGGPLVVFSAHVEPVLKLGSRLGWVGITSATPMAQRAEIVAEFQRGGLAGIAGTIGAMGTGLTLTASHRMIFIDLDFSPAINAQAEDRINRIGQKNACEYIVCTATGNTIDQLINSSIMRKSQMIDVIKGE